MASLARRCLFSVYRLPRRISSPSLSALYAPQTRQWQRPFSITASRQDEDKPINDSEGRTPARNTRSNKASQSTPVESEDDLPPPSEIEQRWMDFAQTVDSLPDTHIYSGKAPMQLLDDLEAFEPDVPDSAFLPTKTDTRTGFWVEGENEIDEDGFDGGPDEDFYGDDITALGHGQLEQHRELREYARLAAWDMPILSKLAKPFELPSSATPFRFRYTSYLGEKHPAINKVVVEFASADVHLDGPQREKLIKLAGPRYNPQTDIIKLSCEKFDTQAQNKRFLGETIHNLLTEAKNPADMFADVPFDFRHHKFKPRHQFPKEWALTPQRKQYLDEQREKLLQQDYEKEELGTLVDGQRIIQESLPRVLPQIPEMVNVGRTKRAR